MSGKQRVKPSFKLDNESFFYYLCFGALSTSNMGHVYIYIDIIYKYISSQLIKTLFNARF